MVLITFVYTQHADEARQHGVGPTVSVRKGWDGRLTRVFAETTLNFSSSRKSLLILFPKTTMRPIRHETVQTRN